MHFSKIARKVLLGAPTVHNNKEELERAKKGASREGKHEAKLTALAEAAEEKMRAARSRLGDKVR